MGGPFPPASPLARGLLEGSSSRLPGRWGFDPCKPCPLQKYHKKSRGKTAKLHEVGGTTLLSYFGTDASKHRVIKFIHLLVFLFLHLLSVSFRNGLRFWSRSPKERRRKFSEAETRRVLGGYRSRGRGGRCPQQRGRNYLAKRR